MKLTTRGKRSRAVVIVLVAMAAALVVGLVLTKPSTPRATPPLVSTAPGVTTTTMVQPPSLGATPPNLSAPPVALPVLVEIPSIHVVSRLLSVGMTAAHAMSAPEGGANSPYWAETFWYRGGSLPGAVGTATIAGHIDDVYGRYAVFGHLAQLVPGDLIMIHFSATGLTERFTVTTTHAYTLAQSATRPVLDLIYGTGPPAGRAPAPSKDGLAHLTLISCTGSWNYSLHTHDERLVVSAVRIS